MDRDLFDYSYDSLPLAQKVYQTGIILLQGGRPPDPANGWAALHAVADDKSDIQCQIMLLNPQPRVDRTLEITGMKDHFEIYTDLNEAIKSF